MNDAVLCTHDPACPLVPVVTEGHTHLPACCVVTLPDGRTLRRSADALGNSYVTFGDGTGAVHTSEGWYEVPEEGWCEVPEGAS